MLTALIEKVHTLREQYPGRRVLVLGDHYCAVFLDCELGKKGVEITVLPLDGGSERQTLQLDPASYSIMVEEVGVADRQSAASKADESQLEQASPKKNPPKRGGTKTGRKRSGVT